MNVNEYVDLALQIIRSNISPQDRSITAAHLGLVLRRAQPEADWRTYGFPSLKALLLTMQERRLVELGQNPKEALAVWPVESTFALEPPEPSRTFNPLAKPFWVAFVVNQPWGRRFFHRPTDTIRMGLKEAPSPGDEWIEIPPISGETQKTWARDFLKKPELKERKELVQALEEPEWFRAFPVRLAAIDPLLVKEWNRLRSVRVSETVKAWCAKYGINPSIAFQSESTRSTLKPQGTRNGQSGHAPLPKSARATVLAALARLPTEYLLEIPIPAKYLLQADSTPTSRNGRQA
jgi:hypothetical protein